MNQPSTPRTFRLPSRWLSGLAWPLAALEALALAILLDEWLLAPVAMVLLHDRHLPASVRTRSLRPFMAPATLVLFAATTAASLDWAGMEMSRVALALTTPLALHMGALLLLRSLRRRGHFLPRVALVGTALETASLAGRLHPARRGNCRVEGQFPTTPDGIDGLLASHRASPYDGLLLVRPPEAEPHQTSALAKLRQISAPIVVVEPRDPHSGWSIDNLETPAFLKIAATFGTERYGYAVTPNAHHLVRLEQDTALAAAYRDADYVLLDSRFVANWLRWTTGMHWPACPGSDVTAGLLSGVIEPYDTVIVIGGNRHQMDRLRLQYRLHHLVQHIPPMGFIRDASAVEDCLCFIERHSPFRFCLLAVGSPQQELLARKLRERGKARGLALCVGASLNFLSGDERRAPAWMQRLGVEWLHRLLLDPRRLARRYLLESPGVFAALGRHPLQLRNPRPQPHRQDGAAVMPATTVPPADLPSTSDIAPPTIRRRTG